MLMNIFRRDNEGASEFRAWERRTKQWNTFSPTVKGEWQSLQGNARTMSLMYGVWINHSGRWGEEFADGATPARDRIRGVLVGPRTLERGGSPTYELVFANGVSDFIEVQNSPVSPTGRLLYLGPYIHDTWTVGPKLTLNLGLRYAYDNGKVPAACREAANPAQCFPDIQFSVYHSLAPRLRFAYDFTGDGRTLLVVDRAGRLVRTLSDPRRIPTSRCPLPTSRCPRTAPGWRCRCSITRRAHATSG